MSVRDWYRADIKLVEGHGYSNPITIEEWDAFILAFLETGAAYKQPLDGFIIPFETLVDVWPMDYVNTVETVVVRKVK